MAQPIMTQNIQVFASTTTGVIPGNDNTTPTGDPFVSCVLELSSLKQTRATEEYTCMSNSNSFTSVGSITKDPITLKTFYTEDVIDDNGGYDLIQTAFETNARFAVLLEFDNSPGVNGTQIWADAYVTSFEITFEKDKAVETNFELALQGSVTIVPAA